MSARRPQRPRKSVSKISVIFKHISEQIKLLYSTSALLKRPAYTDKYLRSNRSESSEIRGFEHYRAYDHAHVREKLLQWHRDWRVANDDRDFVDNSGLVAPIRPPTGRDLGPGLQDNESGVLLMRLARANVKRRKQLQFWKDHADKPESTPVLMEVASGSNVEASSQVMGASTPDSIKPVPYKRFEAKQKIEAKGSEATSRVTFSTVAMTTIQEESTDYVPRTVYAESAVGLHTATRVPPVPQEAVIHSRFDCPFCGLSLNSALMSDRRKWK